MGGKPRRLLVDGSVPTIFQHCTENPSKRRLSSILREEKRTKRGRLNSLMWHVCAAVATLLKFGGI